MKIVLMWSWMNSNKTLQPNLNAWTSAALPPTHRSPKVRTAQAYLLNPIFQIKLKKPQGQWTQELLPLFRRITITARTRCLGRVSYHPFSWWKNLKPIWMIIKTPKTSSSKTSSGSSSVSTTETTRRLHTSWWRIWIKWRLTTSESRREKKISGPARVRPPCSCKTARRRSSANFKTRSSTRSIRGPTWTIWREFETKSIDLNIKTQKIATTWIINIKITLIINKTTENWASALHLINAYIISFHPSSTNPNAQEST